MHRAVVPAPLPPPDGESPRLVAFIDAGGLLAGVSNSEVADRLLRLLPAIQPGCPGVIFFETAKNEWRPGFFPFLF